MVCGGRWAYTYGALAGCAGGLFQGFRWIGGATPEQPFWHPTGAVPIPHTTTRALTTGPPTAAARTCTVRGRPRAVGTERFLDMLPSISHAFVPFQTPNFAQISPKRAPKSPHGGSGGPPSPNGGRRHPPGPLRPGRGSAGGGGLIHTARWRGALEAYSRDFAGSVVPPPNSRFGTPLEPCRSHTQPGPVALVKNARFSAV
jgi:hypothetical protein